MQAMIIRRTGGPEVFELAEIDTPEPGPGEVLIKVLYAGVNPADWKNRQGMLEQFRPYVFPYIIGFDAAGVIAAVGEGVVDLAVGDRVFTPTNHGQGGQGSYAQFTIANADRIAHIPASLSFREAASLPVASLTAWQGLFVRADLAAGHHALIHGGSGGVGSFAVQFARVAGARVAATCSSRNTEYLRKLGVERVIDYTQEDINAAAAEWAPNGLDYLMDAVGTSSLPNALDLVRNGGTLVSIPTLVDDGDIGDAIASAQERGIKREFSVMDDNNCAPLLSKIAGLLDSGQIVLPPISEFKLEDVGAAHETIERGHTRGKIVLQISGDDESSFR